MFDPHLTITGWVGSDVTLRETSNGHQIANFRIATTPRRLREGQWHDGPTSWFTVKAWNRLAQHLHASIKQGDPVVVYGRLVAETWTDDEGGRHRRNVVMASNIGHDLSFGRSSFERSAAAGERPISAA